MQDAFIVYKEFTSEIYRNIEFINHLVYNKENNPDK